MNPDDTLPPVPPAPSAAPAGDDNSELWPSSGPAKGFRVRLPIAIAAVVVVALAGAAAGASLKKTPSTTSQAGAISNNRAGGTLDRKSTRLNSSHGYISYAVFCLK